MEETYYTVAEVAAMLRVSKMTVYRMAAAGEMGAIRLWRVFRIPKSGYEAYLAKARTGRE